MNIITMVNENNRQEILPTDIIKQLSQSHADGCLQIIDKGVTYLIYFEQGKLTYATHSIDPFERLERHLRRLSHENNNLTSTVRTQARLNFEKASAQDSITNYADYKAICWLVEKQYITHREAQKLIELLTKEVFESYLLLSDFSYEVLINPKDISWLCHLDLLSLLSKSQQTLQAWQALAPEISSCYQRPYINKRREEIPPIQQKLTRVLIGFNFRQLAVLLNQDDVKLAESLHPLIIQGIIQLKEPQSPFEQLPRISQTKNLPRQLEINNWESQFKEIDNNQNLVTTKAKIACVDDSPTILQEINRFLDGYNLEVFTINDSVKALMEIMRIKPDLILLDVGMPTVDGYKLCRMIRNSSMFKNTPIVMVTGNTGMVDRAKAKLAGASDYMTKPFSQSDLLKIVFRYLS